MNAGDAADQVIRQVDKLVKNTERASRDVRMEKVFITILQNYYLFLMCPKI